MWKSSCPAAFSKETLLDSRWLLEGVPRVSHKLWHSILCMDKGKQALFMKRILLVHQLTAKRAGKAASLRLGLAEWNLEADRMCFLGFVFQEMRLAVADDGTPLFDDALVDKLVQRSIEGSLRLYVQCFIVYMKLSNQAEPSIGSGMVSRMVWLVDETHSLGRIFLCYWTPCQGLQ